MYYAIGASVSSLHSSLPTRLGPRPNAAKIISLYIVLCVSHAVAR